MAGAVFTVNFYLLQTQPSIQAPDTAHATRACRRKDEKCRKVKTISLTAIFARRWNGTSLEARLDSRFFKMISTRTPADWRKTMVIDYSRSSQHTQRMPAFIFNDLYFILHTATISAASPLSGKSFISGRYRRALGKYYFAGRASWLAAIGMHEDISTARAVSRRRRNYSRASRILLARHGDA